jgi:hypothetical protein
MKWNPLDFVFRGIILVLVECVLIILFSKEKKTGVDFSKEARNFVKLQQVG